MALLWSCCWSLRFSFGQVQSYWHTIYDISYIIYIQMICQSQRHESRLQIS